MPDRSYFTGPHSTRDRIGCSSPKEPPRWAREEGNPMEDRPRRHRVQIMLTPQELRKVDDWRFTLRMPSRTAAVRALIKLGLAVSLSENTDITGKERPS
jgi:hypothetical protein